MGMSWHFQEEFPLSCVRAVVTRGTSQSGDDILNGLTLLLQQKRRDSPLLLLVIGLFGFLF